jgi:hypothetical protein
MYGQDGGVGSDGIPYRDDERAAKGADGTMAEYPYCPYEAGDSLWCFCDYGTAQNELGKIGSKGSNGRAGKNGGRGGDSGVFRMEIAENSPEFNYTVESKAGVSGTPGRGGPPQKGGLGGAPVTKDKDTHVCINDLTAGPEGPPGDKNGADGIKQPDGHVEKSCVSIGDGYGRCSF